ncbi:MAG TPA: TadE family protein [Candidatus Limnocylindrales bacterium]
MSRRARLFALRGRTGRGEAGQGLVEFSFVLMPLLVILGGIIQMGFVFNTQVTITNAAREGARAATIYPYTLTGSPPTPPTCGPTTTRAGNDLCRNANALYWAQQAFGTLSQTAPQFTTGASWTATGTDPNLTYTNGDIVVTYALPSGVTDSDPRSGEQVTVQITYHQDLFIPFIAQLLPHDANGRLAQVATVTMVIN